MESLFEVSPKRRLMFGDIGRRYDSQTIVGNCKRCGSSPSPNLVQSLASVELAVTDLPPQEIAIHDPLGADPCSAGFAGFGIFDLDEIAFLTPFGQGKRPEIALRTDGSVPLLGRSSALDRFLF